MKAGLPFNDQPLNGVGMGPFHGARAPRREACALKNFRRFAMALAVGLKRSCFFAFVGFVALTVQAQLTVPAPSSAGF